MQLWVTKHTTEGVLFISLWYNAALIKREGEVCQASEA